jgi:hypothetical protein
VTSSPSLLPAKAADQVADFVPAGIASSAYSGERTLVLLKTTWQGEPSVQIWKCSADGSGQRVQRCGGTRDLVFVRAPDSHERCRKQDTWCLGGTSRRGKWLFNDREMRTDERA